MLDPSCSLGNIETVSKEGMWEAASGKWKLVASHKASETSDQPFRSERLRENKEAGLKEIPESTANCVIIGSWTRKRINLTF